MSKFLLQSDVGTLDIETLIVKQLLDTNKFTHEYTTLSLNDMNSKIELDTLCKNLIPIGTIDFVSKYIKYAYKIDNENPIEIPKYLRTEEFLKREYRIVTWDKIPDNGNWFIKDVSELKSFGQVVNCTYNDVKSWFEKPEYEFSNNLVLDKTHLFQVSEVFGIKSEYRVYVIGGHIEAISNYNGDCTLLPDVDLIKKAVALISIHEKWLKSYTIDVMVGTKGTAIIEIHNFTSVGLYNTIWGSNLLYAYRDGIDYLINDNKKIDV